MKSTTGDKWQVTGGTSCHVSLVTRHILPPFLLAVALVFFCGATAFGQAYVWKNVAIKGGGFVSGIITHPNAPGVIYCRTDIGGAYRWNATNNSWIPLLDFAADANIYGVESLAIDPSDSNRLYIAASRDSPAVLLVSTNQGATFSQFTPPFSLNGNVDGRSNGERLDVDPNSNNILFYGSRGSGLYKSINYGTNWTQVSSFPVTSTPNSVGLVFVEFIKSSGAPGSATPVIFVGVSQGGTNLFRSADGGATWTGVSTGVATNLMAHHAAQDGLGNMYVTFNDNQGPNNITTGSVIKLNLTTLAASLVTPPKPSGAQGGFAGVSVDRQNPNTVVVSTMDRWYANSPAAPWDVVERSINGGTSWVEVSPNTLPASTSAPWSVARSPHWAGDVEIDPSNSNRVFFITGYGVIGSTNLTAGSVNFAFMNDGLEETVPLGLASPPSGPYLLSAHGDIGGFRHFNLDVSPSSADYFSSHRGTSSGIDFAQSNPNIIARLVSDANYGAYSLNGGTTWTDFPTNTLPTLNGSGSIAVSADGSRFVWIPSTTVSASRIAYWTTNSGVNWTASTGGPTGNRVPISDRVNSNKFYIYSSTRMYVSTDGAATFTQSGTLASGGGIPCAVFGHEGDIWVPLNNGGLTHSINSGASFTAVSGVQYASFVSVGKAATGQSYPAVFIVGRANGDGSLGIYRSDNGGVSWLRINDSQHQFGLGSIHDFCADPRVFGRVYFGTEGRGIIYGQPGNQPPGAIVDLAVVGGNTQITLTWSAVSGADSYAVKRASVSGGSYTMIASGVTQMTYTDTGLTNGVPYYYVVAGTNGFGPAPDSNIANAIPNPPEPIALYALEGNALDTSGNGNNGTANAVSYVAGRIGVQAAQFNGSSAYVQIPRSIQNDFTVAMWVKTTDTAGAAGAQWWSGKGLVDGEVSGGAADWGTAIVNGNFVLGVGSTGGDTTINSSVAINDGAWHHVAATRNNTSGAMAVYVDGVLSGSGTGPTGARTAPPNLRVGSIQTGSGFLNGTIDDVRLYDRVLSAGDIAALSSPPAAPTDLVALAGDGQAALSWSAPVGATGYYVKRSTTSGSGYATIVTNTSLAFTNTGLSNGTIYYFVVSALNGVGESTNSAEVGARSVSFAPTPVNLAGGNTQLLQLVWPQDHTGWQVQVQTNAPGTGLGTNWITISGSGQTNQFNLPVDAANGSVFLRLVSP
jgi:hypothetical protein